MLPSLSRVMPHGLLNSPSPLPLLPHWVRALPAGVKTCRRSLPLSTTITLPPASQVVPAGFFHSPRRLSPLANEFACRIEDRDGVRPLVRHVHGVVLVHRDAERPDGMSVCFAVRAELSKQFFLARAADLHAIDPHRERVLVTPIGDED